MQYLLLFLEGIITFISPCLLPMLPLYVSYFSAGEPGRRRAVVNSLGFVSGFTLVFVALGAFAGAAGRLLIDYAAAVNIVTGLIIIIFGLNYLGVLNIAFLNRGGSKAADVRDLRFLSSLAFGAVFSVGWTPCVSAFLGMALMMAVRRGAALTGILMLTVFSLGLGVPFVASAILIDRLKNAFDFIKRNYKIVNAVSGALLIITGVLMMTGLLGRLMSLISA